MKVESLNCMSNTYPNFKGHICDPLAKRAKRFCTPDKMLEYTNSLYSSATDAATKKLRRKYTKNILQINYALTALCTCMQNLFDENSYLTIRKVKEVPDKSVLSLFNTRTGKILDVSSHFDTENGNISRILLIFAKKAQNLAHEIQKD